MVAKFTSGPSSKKRARKLTTWPQASRSGYLTMASTFLAMFMMKNKVKTTMHTGEEL